VLRCLRFPGDPTALRRDITHLPDDGLVGGRAEPIPCHIQLQLQPEHGISGDAPHQRAAVPGTDCSRPQEPVRLRMGPWALRLCAVNNIFVLFIKDNQAERLGDQLVLSS